MNTAFDKHPYGYYRVLSEYDSFRIGTAGKSINNINYRDELKNIRKNEKNLLSGLSGIPAEKIFFLDQVHGDKIMRLDSFPDEDLFAYGEADGIVTGLPGACLVIRTADCVPVFAYDTKNNVLGATHSGWKGTKLKIVSTMVKIMCREYSSIIENINIFILPSIGPDSYEVKNDVADYFHGFTRQISGKIHLDLWKHIEATLVETGVPEKNIFNSGTCTLISNSEFFSHRKGDPGRNLNFAYIK